MSAKLEHAPTRKLSDGLAHVFVAQFAHHAIDFHYITQPPVSNSSVHKLKSSIVTEHVTHLHDSLGRFSGSNQTSVLRHRVPAWLIEMDMQSRIYAALGCRH